MIDSIPMLYQSEFSQNDTKKFLRQLTLDECTVKNQNKLFNTKILIVGLGGLGIPCSLYLVGAGCRNLGIIDGDNIELSNLHRQVAFNEEDIGKSKAEILGKKLKMMDSKINLEIINEFLTKKNLNIIEKYDLIVDCSDNISTRYLMNDASRNKIFVCASVLRWHGEIYLFSPEEACYRCLYPVMKTNVDTCNDAGIIGGICGTIGSFLAVEIIKIIFDGAVSKMMIYDAKESSVKKMTLRERKKNCIACRKKTVSNDFNFSPKKTTRIDEELKISWQEYLDNKNKYDLIDIRPAKFYKLAHIIGSRNIQINDKFTKNISDKKIPVILCNKGISAQKFAKELLDKKIDCRIIKDGLMSFKKNIDDSFPL